MCCECAYGMCVQSELEVALFRLNQVSWKQFFIYNEPSAESENELTCDREKELM